MEVDCSWITDVFYNGEDSILTVLTKAERAYHYPNVSLATWVDLVEASRTHQSIGKFIRKHVINKGIKT